MAEIDQYNAEQQEVGSIQKARATLGADESQKRTDGLSDEGLSTTQETSRILQLPGELRDRIFSFAVAAAHPIDVNVLNYSIDKAKAKAYWRISDGRPLLAQVCKAIRSDVLSTYYSENTFRLWQRSRPERELHKLDIWTTYLGACAKHLTSVVLFGKLQVKVGGGKSFETLTEMEERLLPHGTVVLKLTCSLHEIVGQDIWDHRNYRETDDVRHCVCDAYRLAAASELEGKDGRRLLELAHGGALDTDAEAETCECPRCKLPKVHIVERMKLK